MLGIIRDVMRHQLLRTEQMKDWHMASLHFPLLFQHGELGWHLADRYQSDATCRNNNNNRVSCSNFAAYGLCIKSNGYSVLCCKIVSVFSTLIAEMSVPSLPVSVSQYFHSIFSITMHYSKFKQNI